MPPENFKEWIKEADNDIGFGELNLDHEDYSSRVCFFFQQGVEKYLKAFIVYHKLDFKKTHNLLTLLEICRQKDNNIEEIKESCIFLNPFYIDTRYPVHWPSNYDKTKVLKAFEEARKVRNYIKNVLNS